MEYVRPKLKINRYKHEMPHILFRLITQEIDHITQTKLNFSLDYDLSLWLIRLMILNPKYGIGYERPFDRTVTDALIEDYVQIVSDPDSIFVAIIKMQIYYIDHYIDKSRIITKHQATMNAKMEPLTRLIINTRLKSKSECDEYVKKLAVDIIAHYGLGNPENGQVIQETQNALKSMMSTNDVMGFSTLCEKDKIESLSGIREIVCGMRAFNRDAGHCGEGLIDIEKTVRNGYKTTKLQLNTSLKEISSRIETLMATLGKLPSFDMLPSLIENNNVIKSITLNRQCERFLYDLLNILDDHHIHIDRLLKNFRSQLNKIHEIVKFRTAIPITSIFPKFIELAALWEHLQHQTYILSEINTVNGQLMLLAQIPSYDVNVRDHHVLTVSPNYGVNEDKSIYDGTKVDRPKIINASKNRQIKIVPYEVNLKVEYEAFCVWTVSNNEGLLLPADLTNGLVQYENKHYGFSTVEAIDWFIQNPDTCLANIIMVICRNQELVHFFDMYDSLEQIVMKSNENAYKYSQNDDECSQRCSIGIQTDVHPIRPYKMDKHHKWNIWDMRRDAIKLANIRKCQTKSTQTCCQSTFGTQTNL
ncbi:cilia- and flagella-associated protein 206 [Contarinia nasturtii]|uniref:cilia- and flagella-associated protein 206 n=1 Tax=Contarinia nasturtii TaxID=265458 RepID=UPI0012D3936F|nr:cilia- and flagella-associated protein 206 [Contarinia nasturtii]